MNKSVPVRQILEIKKKNNEKYTLSEVFNGAFLGWVKGITGIALKKLFFAYCVSFCLMNVWKKII